MHLSWGRIFYYTLEEEETQEVNVPLRGWFYFVCFIKFSQETYCTETSLLSLRDRIHRWQRRGTMQTLFNTDCGSHVTTWLCGDSWSMIEHEDSNRNQRLQGAFKSLLLAISQKQQYAFLPMRLYDCPWTRQNAHNKKISHVILTDTSGRNLLPDQRPGQHPEPQVRPLLHPTHACPE